MRLLVVIPAYNEAPTIPAVVAGVRAQSAADILVVDDGSSDETSEVAKGCGVVVLRHPCNLGIGAAVQSGFLYAIEHDYDSVVRIDGDGQHDPAYIKQFLEPLCAGTADIVIGSRFLARRGYQSTFVRRTGIVILSLISALVGARVTDPTSGYWALNRRALSLLAVSHPDDYPETEAMVVATRGGCRIREIPVQMLARTAGRSSISAIHSGFYMFKVIVAVLIQRLRR
jgi:glycosyltransferase involved in cell wall biosynthesis